MTELKRTKRIIAIRVRGRTGVRKEVQDTLKMLRLNRVNHAVIVDDRPSYLGMLKKAEFWITYGYLDKETFKQLLLKRGRLEGNKRFTEDYLVKHTRFSSLDEFVEKFFNFEAELSDIPKLKPVFRLHPPRGGYEGIKHHFNEGGALGFRGDKINELVKRML